MALSERLKDATIGLSYDLAVIQANYLIDLSLRGDDGLRAFHNEAAALLERVTGEWAVGCARLTLSSDDGSHVTLLTEAFSRVGDALGNFSLASRYPHHARSLKQIPEPLPPSLFSYLLLLRIRPLPPFVEALAACPRIGERYWFWIGVGSQETLAGNWRRTFRRLCEIADIEGGHPHRFRDTLANYYWRACRWSASPSC